MKRIAIIGAGVAGLICAYRLRGDFAPVVFEREPRLGGHAHTGAVRHRGRELAVDFAFMVYNRRNYPRFCETLDELGIGGRATKMSFSVAHEEFGLEYNGGSVAGLAADWRNLARGDFWRLIGDILRFNRRAKADLARGGPPESETLRDYLRRGGFGRFFADGYLLPMGASIWSCAREDFAAAPARFVVSFFHNYGLLDLAGRPQWLHIGGGARRYVDALAAALGGAAQTGCAAESARAEGGRIIVCAGGREQAFDAAVLALHAPDALALIADASAAERETLGAFRYTDNEAVLHDDASILPRRKRAWASWNYRVWGGGESARAAATYNLSMLQGLGGARDHPLLLTLNAGVSRIDPARILRRYRYAHPLPDAAAMRARRRRGEISGKRGLFFCGAYWGDGFHEDGAASGADAAAEVRRYFAENR